MTLPEKKLCSVGRKWMYIFNHRKAKKLIPAESLSMAEECQRGGRVEARNRSSQSAELPNQRVCHSTSGQDNLKLTPEGGRHMVLLKDEVGIGNADSRCGMGWRLQRRFAFALLNAIHWRRFYAHAIPILCYHAIPSRRTFEMQMACIRECGWTVVGLRDVIGWIARQKTPKLPAIVLTFDDCFTTQFTNAVPVLTQFSYPGTFFAVSRRIGQHLDWDGPKGTTGPSLMGRGELLELRQRGFDVGCHSRTHRKLSDIPFELQKMEISGGKQDIENILGEEVWCFSYPYGNHTPALVNIVKECGFSAAVSVQVGAVHLNDNPFTLKRLCVPVEASNEELMAQFTWIPHLAEIVRRVPHLDVLARRLWTSS